MTVSEAINRGNNLFAVGVLGVAGLTFGEQAFGEGRLFNRADDLAVALLAVVAIVWLIWGRNQYKRSWLPVTLLGIALAIQIAAWIGEVGEPAAFGDDVAGVVIFAVAVGIASWLVYHARRSPG